MARILHVSDIHCQNDILKRVLAEEDYDLVVSTGDFECIDTARIFLENAKARALAVTGNLDNPGVARLLREKGALIDGRVIDVDGLLIAGVGGMEVLGNIRMIKSAAPSRPLDLLVTHHPPRGVLDKTFYGVNAGIEELWELINLLTPRYHLFGHIHESPGVLEGDGGVVFVNAGPLARGRYAVIDLEEGRVELREVNR